ncbi:MAG: oligosaccharide flippase family protein [Xanthomonadales bacterium]|nr:oligosaccharide flippase family protein [Xanthomonadales bacterium]
MAKLLKRLTDTRSLASGAALYVGYRWFDRFLGVISLAVLARLLDPESFGIVAMAWIVVGLLDAIFDMGVHLLVLQKDDPDKEFLDTAWTLRLIQAIVTALIIAGLAPLAVNYFSEPRVANVMYVLALASFIGGLENFAVVEFQKSRQFFREFQLSAIKRLSTFFAIIGLAFVLGSYWALVIGTLISRILGVFLAYFFHRVTHRPSFAVMGTLFHKGKWLLFMNVAAYIWKRIDEIVVGRFFSSAVLGSYSVAAEVARLPTAELMAPISRALLPGFTSSKGDVGESANLIRRSINVQASLALPAAAGLAICADPVVSVFLGAKWQVAAQLLAILPAIFAAAALRYTGEYYLIAHERQRLLTFVDLYYLVAFLGWIAYSNYMLGSVSLQGVVYGRAAVEASGIVIMWFVTASVSGAVSVWDQILQILRPLLATLAMCGVLLGVPMEYPGAVTQLAYTVPLGVVTYAVVLVTLWLVSGKPEGLERWVADRLAARLRRAD